MILSPQVVLLDEPTQGLEPKDKQRVWELLHSRKDMRVIVCTTQSMEEARFFAGESKYKVST